MLTDQRPAVDDGRTGEVRPAVGLWVSVAELARLKGVSKQAVHKRVNRLAAEGLVSTRKQGRELHVNVAEFDRAVGETTDPAQALRNGKPATTAPDSNASSYTAARAAREGYQAENARLDLEARLGRLVDRDEVDRRTFDTFRRLRDRLLAMPATICDRVAAAPDSRAVRTVLEEEIRALLTKLAETLDHEESEDLSDAA